MRYGTGPLTFMQAAALVALNIIGQFFSSTNDGGIVISVLYVLLTILWFGMLTLLGYATEQRRSRPMAIVLACLEGIVALVALFDLTHANGAEGFITSLVDLSLALIVIYLAYRIAVIGKNRASKTRPQRLPQRSRHR